MYIYIYHYLPSTEIVYCKVVIVIVDFYYQDLNQLWMNAVTKNSAVFKTFCGNS
jgi:hypothetical protein